MMETFGEYSLATLLAYLLYFESSPQLHKTEVVHIAAVIQERADNDVEGGPWPAVLRRVCVEGGQFASLWIPTPNLEDYDQEKWVYCSRIATLLIQHKIPRTEGYTHFYSSHGKIPYWGVGKNAKKVGGTCFLRLEN